LSILKTGIWLYDVVYIGGIFSQRVTFSNKRKAKYQLFLRASQTALNQASERFFDSDAKGERSICIKPVGLFVTGHE
jgi:hypothetical protein